MRARFVLIAGVLLGAVLLAAGCGSSGEDKDKESEGARTACKAPALSGDSGLPAAFPIPGELTLTRTRKDGPSTVVDGYWSADLDEVYGEYKDQVGQAGYSILFDEKEEHDAEISYKGSGRTGQIALRDDCTESDTIRVHITNRPA
ncbi:MAG TPA: hypothetical protein VFB35_02185 [Gaiellaceae bacterium]|nr:hypothetical protein [Gaiellaceae bacterium]